MININEGKNEKIVNQCKKLAEYSVFVSKSYYFKKEIGDREQAVDETVKFCQKHGILKEFFETYGSEVLSMLLEEWDMDEAREVWREEALEEGRTEGIEEGREKLSVEILELFEQGCSIEEVKKVLHARMVSVTHATSGGGSRDRRYG